MLIEYSHGSLSFEEVIKFLGFTGMYQNVYSELLKSKEVAKQAKDLGIVVSDEELQDVADNFRIRQGLHTAEDMNTFLTSLGLTVDDFENFCENIVSTRLFEAHLTDEKHMEEYFVNNRTEFDLARVSSIIVKEENLANEIKMQVEEDDEDFHALARQYSVDKKTKYRGGYVGAISRRMLPPEISAKVFNAEVGDLLGPFQRDDLFQLILIEEVIKADLNDDRVKESVGERIFNEWATQFLKGGVWVDL